MNMQSNTIFVTGGGAGIGKGLAEAFHRLGNRIIIGGRREHVLEGTCAANPGMSYVALDVRDPAAIQAVAARVTSEFPALNCVINNAGVQRLHDFSSDEPLDEMAMQEEIGTNILGIIRVAAAFLPHLRNRENATLVNISSGLAFVPYARFPIYCATKAAVHSFSLSLRHQLRNTSVKVIELVPPYVATDLDKTTRLPGRASRAMPLDEFIAAAMEELATGADEAAIGPAKAWLEAGSNETLRKSFAGMNR